MATTSEMRFEDSPLRGSSWFQLCSSHSGGPGSPRPRGALREETRYPGEGWSAPSLNPGLRVVNPYRLKAIHHTLASPTGFPVALLATEGRLVCLLLVQQFHRRQPTASETENAP